MVRRVLHHATPKQDCSPSLAPINHFRSWFQRANETARRLTAEIAEFAEKQIVLFAFSTGLAAKYSRGWNSREKSAANTQKKSVIALALEAAPGKLVNPSAFITVFSVF